MKNLFLTILFILACVKITFSQQKMDTTITVVHVYKSAYSSSTTKVNKYGVAYLERKVHSLFLIDTIIVDPNRSFVKDYIKQNITYKDGDILFFYHRTRPIYSFIEKVEFKNKKISKLLIDDEFKRKLIVFGINLDQIDPSRIVNNQL
jgi:hypothetical protein